MLKFFPKNPPYELSSFYLLKLEPSLKSIEEIESLNTCYITENSCNKSLKDHLTLVKLPKHKTILYINSSKRNYQLIEALSEADNTIKILSSKKKEILEKNYLEIRPDIIVLPLHLKKTLEKIALKHPSNKPILGIFYPPTPFSRNFIVTLSKEILKKKRLSCKNSSLEPTESFLLKKLMITSDGKVLLKRVKASIFNGDTTLSLPKRSHPIIFKEHDKILAMGNSLEDIKLGLQGFFYELAKTHTRLSLHTKTFSESLEIDLHLASCEGSFYLFVPEKHPSNKILLKKLKEYLKNHSNKEIFVGYYGTPWLETWNLYHHHKSVSLEKQESPAPECYLVRRLS